jgi:hypothetical protein
MSEDLAVTGPPIELDLQLFFTTMIVCQALSSGIRRLTRSTMKTFSYRDQCEWLIRWVSTFHALFSTVASVHMLFLQELPNGNGLAGVYQFARVTSSVSVGTLARALLESGVL